MANLPGYVQSARSLLAERLASAKQAHSESASARKICELLTAATDEVVNQIFCHAGERLTPLQRQWLEENTCLVAVGGYARRELAPYSDVDLLLLTRSVEHEALRSLAERFFPTLYDVGLRVGHSVRTVHETVSLARQDPEVLTAVLETRPLLGNSRLLDSLRSKLLTLTRRHCVPLVKSIVARRFEERMRFGETIYLLEPNVKRSEGGLRDYHLLRWFAVMLRGTSRLDELVAAGILTPQHLQQLEDAVEFLLGVRHFLHFRAGHAQDVLTRWEQLELARQLGLAEQDVHPVEALMRQYFRHTERISQAVRQTRSWILQSGSRKRWYFTPLRSRRVGSFLVTPEYVTVCSDEVEKCETPVEFVLELLCVASEHDKPVDELLLPVLRRRLETVTVSPTEKSKHYFLKLLNHPTRLGEFLSLMHELELLEYFIPGMQQARGLLQFNQYHKYTVDQHCLRAVEFAAQLMTDGGLLGETYRRLPRKYLLHLALLIHDLGKAFQGDHSEQGAKLAQQAAAMLGLSPKDSRDLVFLVRRHLLLNHMALRRDVADPALAAMVAAQVGSPELLEMLYVFTAADLAAISPGNWTRWKANLVSQLFTSAMKHLTGPENASQPAEQCAARRKAILAMLSDKADVARFEQQVESLPEDYLLATSAEVVVQDLQTLFAMQADEVRAVASVSPDKEIIELVVYTNESKCPGIFHRLTGALTSKGLDIVSAQIHTLPDGWVVDRFWTRDTFGGHPPSSWRLEEIVRAVEASLANRGEVQFRFPRTWFDEAKRPISPDLRTEVYIDNQISDRFTVIDVFAVDRRGLLFEIARCLFVLDLSVARAKVGTYLDQVVDVFYVTDRSGQKVTDGEKLDQIRRRLLEVIEGQT